MTHWSRTQSVVTTSSCEAELLAISAGAQEGLLLQKLWEELGEAVKLTIFTDSKAAVDWISKKGAGRLKHIKLRQFGVQEVVRLGRFTLQHVAGATNTADMLTKFLAGNKLRQAAALAGLDVEATED